MLSTLVIKNFAIIDRLEINLEAGMSVLTGETGAGKSIIIAALNLLLGGRASIEVIRSSFNEAVVEGIFEATGRVGERIAAQLERLGISAGDGQTIIRRTITRSGRNKVFVNGCLTTLTTLKELTRGLIDISGQHEHYSLMDTSGHIEILDRFACLEAKLTPFTIRYEKLSGLEEEKKKLLAEARTRHARADYLNFQLEELDEATLDPDEVPSLHAELSALEHAEILSEVTFQALSTLYERDGSTTEQLSVVAQDLEHVAKHAATLETVAQLLREASSLVEDAVCELQSFEVLDANPKRLDQIQVRLDTIERLERKFCLNVPELIEERERMRSELEGLLNTKSRLEAYDGQIELLRGKLLNKARKLSRARAKAARRLEEMIEEELTRLGMGSARLCVDIDTDEKNLRRSGIDQVAFLLSPNRGEEPKPLGRIASGGELSRVMLAIKRVLASQDDVLTYVFDEVDTGVGGAVAEQIARTLHRVSRDHQVFCITHLATIASYGDQHFAVRKQIINGRTVSDVQRLGKAQRVQEIARMLGGIEITERTLEHAAEMVDRALH